MRAAEGELEAELAVGFDQWRGQRFADDDAGGHVFEQPAVERLEGELGAPFVGRAGVEQGAVGEWREAELTAEFELLLGEAVEVVVAGELYRGRVGGEGLDHHFALEFAASGAAGDLGE